MGSVAPLLARRNSGPTLLLETARLRRAPAGRLAPRRDATRRVSVPRGDAAPELAPYRPELVVGVELEEDPDFWEVKMAS